MRFRLDRPITWFVTGSLSIAWGVTMVFINDEGIGWIPIGGGVLAIASAWWRVTDEPPGE